MMKTTLNVKYKTGKESNKATTTLSINGNVGDAKLSGSVTGDLALDAIGYSDPSLSLSLEKPNFFSIDYSPKTEGGGDGDDNVPNVKFKFINSIRLMEKTVNMAYSHALREKKTAVEGWVAFNEWNKVAVSHTLGTTECKLKYTYACGRRRKTVLETTYDVGANAWDLAVSTKLDGGHALKASYQQASKTVGLEWSRDTSF